MDRYLRLKDASKFSRLAAAAACMAWALRHVVQVGQAWTAQQTRMPDSPPDAPPPFLLWFPARLSSLFRLSFTRDKVESLLGHTNPDRQTDRHNLLH